MTAETRLIARLLVFVDRSAMSAGHLAQTAPAEHLGVCVLSRRYVGGTRVKDGAGFRMADQTLSGVCTDACQEFQAVRTEARAYLEAHEPRQVPLELVS